MITCYFEPGLGEDIKSNSDSEVITESQFEQEWNTTGMAPILSK